MSLSLQVVPVPVMAPMVLPTSICPPVVTKPLNCDFLETLRSISLFTSTALRFPLIDITRAASPETCGHAMLVPLIVLYEFFGKVDKISEPGANTWA